MRFASCCCLCLALALLSACGFHLPHQTKLDEAVPELNVEGDYHHQFYKMVVQKLRISGVKVNSQGDPGFAANQEVPTLLIPEPSVDNVVVAVDSRAQALERNLFVQVAMTLLIPHHRPIIMRNSLTRTVLNKTGHSLASENEIDIVTSETYEELASQMVIRIGYLGRESDPDARVPLPQDLVTSADDPSSQVTAVNPYEGMTLIEALQQQDAEDQAKAQQVDLNELNNGSVYTNPQLPPIEPQLKHEAPDTLNTKAQP